MVFLTKLEKQALSKVSFVKNAAGKVAILQAQFGTQILLYAWGSGANGRLGDETTTAKSSPIQIGTLSWLSVSAGDGIAGAIRSDGLLFTWGRNDVGQLGLGDTTVRSSPVQVGSSSWTMVSAGRNHMQAIRSDGRLFGWGDGSFGRMGTSPWVNQSSPNVVGSSSWIHVRVGNQQTAGITIDNKLFAWGNNGGMLGDGTTSTRYNPTQIGSSSWTFVSMGYSTNGRGHTMAIRSDGLLFAWGYNQIGQLGLEDTATRSSPTQVGSSSWTSVTAGAYFTAAVRSDGLLFTWGNGGNGRLGDDTTVSKSSPVQVGTSSWTVVNTSSTSTHVSAVRSDNLLFMWGNNANGELGDGTLTTRSSPTQIGSDVWTLLSPGRGSTHGLRTST
jgi:alpha-tubulin suppressor-like RCC1 family protein